MAAVGRFVAVVALGSALLVVAAPAGACGCGAVVTADNLGVYDEAALVRHDGRTEDIVMRLTLSGEPADAAWILPVPATPTFALGPDGLFDDLVEVTRPRVEVRKDWFPPIGAGGGDTAGAAPGSDVSVLGRTTVGPYDVATLAASDGNALSQWLTAHGYTLDPELAQGAQPYADAGWQYVAVKLSAPSAGETLGRTLPPLRVTFASPEIVYPMRLTATAEIGPSLRLFVLAPHRVRRDGQVGPTDSDLRFAGWVEPASAGESLATLVDERMFLTRFDQQVAPESVTDDYRFTFADKDTAYRTVVYETEPVYVLGLPAGPVLIAVALVGLVMLTGLAVLVVVRRRSKSAAR